MVLECVFVSLLLEKSLDIYPHTLRHCSNILIVLDQVLIIIHLVSTPHQRHELPCLSCIGNAQLLSCVVHVKHSSSGWPVSV